MNFADNRIRIHHWIPMDHDHHIHSLHYSEDPKEKEHETIVKEENSIKKKKEKQIKIKFFNRSGYKN